MMDEWVFTKEEIGVIVLALDNALADCFFDDDDARIAGKLLDEMED